MLHLAIGGIEEEFVLLWHGCFIAVSLWHGCLVDNTLSDIDRFARLWFDCELGFSVNERVLLRWVFASCGCTLIAIERCFGHKHIFHCLSHWFVNSLVGGILSCHSGLRLTPWLDFICAFARMIALFLSLIQICVNVITLGTLIPLSSTCSTSRVIVFVTDDRRCLGNKKLDIFLLFDLLFAQLQLSQNPVLTCEVRFQIWRKKVYILLRHNSIQRIAGLDSLQTLVRPFNLFSQPHRPVGAIFNQSVHLCVDELGVELPDPALFFL